ncbi:uncharacterized protein LOC135214627 [Macrobrachium nipponense]|uniref:uncharacterized protein LOC135214627 n=1 Tax=Macrobrachium nipponense TaxID=159736 RepID=UPI0030C8A2AD
MAHRLATYIGLVACLVAAVAGKGVPIDDDEYQAIFDDNHTFVGEGYVPDSGHSAAGILHGFLNLERDAHPVTTEKPGSVSSMYVDSRLAGNFLYSLLGFVLGGGLLFVSLFDPTRKPVIRFFDKLFGNRVNRRRRDIGQGLEGHVATAFDAFTNAIDKMELVSKIARH